MTDTPQFSGADLARQALAAARANAKNTPTGPAPKRRRTASTLRRTAGDPQGLGNVLARLTAEQGWEAGMNGGSILDQWTSICPAELATTVQPAGYDPDTGTLTLRPSSPAYGTRLRMAQQQLAQHLNGKLGHPAVRGIKVLPPGGIPAPATSSTAAPAARPKEDRGPVRTRDTASAGYRSALEAALTHRPDRQPTDPYTLEAIARQEAALRAHRQPETEHPDAVEERERLERQNGPSPGSVDASLARARAHARRERAGQNPPRRALDVA